MNEFEFVHSVLGCHVSSLSIRAKLDPAQVVGGRSSSCPPYAIHTLQTSPCTAREVRAESDTEVISARDIQQSSHGSIE